MSHLSQLESIGKNKKRRLGRGLGSGAGAKSGRGTTRHQKAREDIPLHFEGGQGRMVKRFPLLRGKGRNKSIFGKPLVLSLTVLELIYKDGATVDMKSLLEFGAFEVADVQNRGVKIVATGAVTKALHIALPISESAKRAIEKVGGSVK